MCRPTCPHEVQAGDSLWFAVVKWVLFDLETQGPFCPQRPRVMFAQWTLVK